MSQAINDIINDLSRIPPFPEVTTKLLRLLDDSDAPVEELAQLIASDPSLMLTVIHMANSPFYMCSRRIENIRDAVLVLGINTIKGITTAISVQQGLRKLCPPSHRFDHLAYWRHAYATAIAAARLAHERDVVVREKVYFVGLIHDVGKIFEIYYWPDSWDAILKLVQGGDMSYADAESQILGFRHFEIACQVLARWQFPPDIVELVRFIHTGESSTAALDSSRRILTLAHQIPAVTGYHYPAADQTTVEPEAERMAASMEGTFHEELEYQLGVLLK